MDWEFHFLNWIQENWHNDVLTTVLRWITTLGNGGILWILLSLLLWIPRKTRKCGISMSLSLLLCGILGNLILKPWIGRIRPYDINTSIELLLPALSDFSFPSGHTYAAFAGAVTLFIFYKKTGIAALILACLIAFSRLYFYVHFPTDIMAGMVMGILLACLSVWLVRRFLWPRLPASFTREHSASVSNTQK